MPNYLPSPSDCYTFLNEVASCACKEKAKGKIIAASERAHYKFLMGNNFSSTTTKIFEENDSYPV